MTKNVCSLFVKDSIPTRLFKIVFGVYIFVATTMTLFHMVFEYYYIKNSVRLELQNLQKTFEQGLSTALWRIDLEQLESTTSGIIEVPVIDGVRVADMQGDISVSSGRVLNEKGELLLIDTLGKVQTLEGDAIGFDDLFWYEFTLKSFNNEPIGTVTLYSSSRVVFGRVQLGFLFIIINSIIKSAALWFIFIQVSRRLLTRPLNDLTHATQKINFDTLENAKVDVVKLEGENELSTLENAFNRMIWKLNESSGNLKRAEEVSRTILESSPNPIIVYNTYGHIIYLNPSFTKLFGWTAAEFGNSNPRFIPEAYHEEASQIIERINASENEYLEFDSQRYNKAGEIIDVHITTAVYRKPDQSIVGRVHTLQDITQRKRAESELKKRENLYRMIFENSPVGIVHFNKGGEITACNQAMNRILGHSNSVEKITCKTLHTPKNEALRSAFQAVLNGRESFFEGEYKGISKDSENWVKVEFRPIIEKGIVMSGVAIFEDITSRKQYEEYRNHSFAEMEQKVEERTSELKTSLEALKNAQDGLIRSERLVALGSMVAGVAHEINTPLGVGVTAISYLGDQLKEVKSTFSNRALKRSDFEKFLDATGEATSIVSTNLERATELIQSFKQVAVDQSGEQKRTFILKKYIHDVLLSLRPKYKKTSHHIIVNCPEEIELDSYPGAFSQIITNLITNSLIHAFENIEVGEMRFDVERVDGELYFNYSDNGVGMEPAVTNQIFDPFFTTKRTAGGTGLGMHIVYNLVSQKLGGHIGCFSEPGKGTEFKITLSI